MTETLNQSACGCRVLRQLFSRLCGVRAVSPQMLCDRCREELQTTPRTDVFHRKGTSLGLPAVCWTSVECGSATKVETRWISSSLCRGGSGGAKQDPPLEGALNRALRLWRLTRSAEQQ